MTVAMVDPLEKLMVRLVTLDSAIELQQGSVRKQEEVVELEVEKLRVLVSHLSELNQEKDDLLKLNGNYGLAASGSN